MNVNKDHMHGISEYSKNQIFRVTNYNRKKNLSEIQWDIPRQARFKCVMKKGTWIPGKNFPEYLPDYSITRYSFDQDKKTFIHDEQKGLETVVRMAINNLNSNKGWNYVKIWMTLDKQKLTGRDGSAKSNYNHCIAHFGYKKQFLFNDSVGFQKFGKNLIIDPSVFKFKPLN